MTNYTVKEFANYDDFKTYVETLATTTDIQVVYSAAKGWIVIEG